MMKQLNDSRLTVENIMTPRSVLCCVDKNTIEMAPTLAGQGDFDAIPIIDGHGTMRRYWNREQIGIVRITRNHSISHNVGIDEALPRLRSHGIQFVYYRTEIIGLVDVADLNKPLARLVWLYPMLECEQYLVEKTLELGLEENTIIKALEGAAQPTIKRREKALHADLNLPLLSFAYFRDVLAAGINLGIIDLNITNAERLNGLRNKLAHPTRKLIEKKDECKELEWAKVTCQQILRSVCKLATKKRNNILREAS